MDADQKQNLRRIRMAITVFLMIVFFVQINQRRAIAKESTRVNYAFFPISEITLEQITSGQVGEGYLLYYRRDLGVQKPGLIVHLVRIDNSSDALAEVFEAPPGKNYVPLKSIEQLPQIVAGLPPSVIIRAKGGWWSRNGLPNYNLDIQVNGPIQASWGGDLFSSLIKVGEPAVSIMVRDTDTDGIPDWDLRNVIPSFPGRGFIRSNYAQRKCDTPTTLDQGISPMWPYLSSAGGYEQLNASLRGPIVADWDSGKIIFFSELVSVRNQNCGYAFYALEPISTSQKNQPNFETPFAIYDLSGNGVGYPNMVIRAERYLARDPWMPGLDRDYETIRYSWRNEVGDLEWDYKLEMLGFHTYASLTEIAGGLSIIDAPAYEFLPHWVIEKPWPVVTFVDAEWTQDRSSEGIYEWSPRELGDSYFLGRSSFPNPGAFSDIREGYRGEYRSDRSIPPELYVSPIDWRLHLRGAQAGLFNLGEGTYLREVNLDGGMFINGWIRYFNPSKTDLEQMSWSSSTDIEEALFAFEDYLLYIGPQGIELRKFPSDPEFLRTSPPGDNESWWTFRQQIEPYTSRRKDPDDLHHWLDEFPGKSLCISGAWIEQVRKTSDGFRFIIELQPDFKVWGYQDFGLSKLTPGKYLVEYSGNLNISPLTPPLIEIDINPGIDSLTVQEPNLIQMKLINHGLEDLNSSTLVLQVGNGIEFDEIDRLPVTLTSGKTVSLNASWQPKNSGPWVIDARLESLNGSELFRTLLFVIVQEEQSSFTEINLSLLSSSIRYGVIVLLLFFALLVIATFRAANRLS